MEHAAGRVGVDVNDDVLRGSEKPSALIGVYVSRTAGSDLEIGNDLLVVFQMPGQTVLSPGRLFDDEDGAAFGVGLAAGTPLVATFHTHFVSYFRYYGFGLLERLGWRLLERFYRPCALVFTPSQAIADELEGHGIGPVRIWSRGVETDRFSPACRDAGLRSAAGADEEAPLVLMVSRLVKEKDLLDLPPMSRALRDRGIDHRLVLVGDGPLRDELVAALPDAHFVGYQEGESLSRWYASADVFVFPSTTETFGNVVQESLASGVPAVVVDRGGPRTVLEPGVSGLVARSNDPGDLADKVGRLLRDRELRGRMSRAAREQMLGRSWPRVNDALLDGYCDVTGLAGPTRSPSDTAGIS